MSVRTETAEPRRGVLAKLTCPVGRGAGREDAICRAVIDLLNESSYEAVTMDAVAARAKASKATIYRRWSNKNDLVVAALIRVLGHQQHPLPDTGSLRSDLIARISAQATDPELMAANTAGLKTLIFAGGVDAGLAGKVRTSMRSAQLPLWQAVLDRAHARGELGDRVDAALVHDIAMAQFCSRITIHCAPVDAQYIEHVVDAVLLPVVTHAAHAAHAAAVT